MTDIILEAGIPDTTITVRELQDAHGEPVSYPIQPVKLVTGDKNNYRIDYGNGLVEMGGIVQVECSVVTTGVIEGTKVIELPFGTTYDFQATAMNVIDAPNVITGESAFITEVRNGYKIYATAKSTQSKTIPVKWSAEGTI